MRSRTQNSEYVHKYYLIDLLRIILAIGIVCLHLEPFKDCNLLLNWWFSYILARICVPLFFMISGFFLFDKIYRNDVSKIKRFIFHTIKLYVVMTVIYLPLRIIKIHFLTGGENSNIHNILFFLRDFIFVGSYQHLWYFVALLWGCLGVIVLNRYIKNDRIMIIIAIVLYAIGTVLNAYFPQYVGSIPLYQKVFVTTRNGFFVGFPFILAGYFCKKYEQSILNLGAKFFCLLLLILFVSLNIEGIMVYKFVNNTYSWDILFTILPLCISLFALLINCEHSQFNFEETPVFNKEYRDMSLLIFEFHLLFASLFDYCMMNIVLNSFFRFLIVIVCTFSFGKIILFLSRNNKYLRLFFL